jgi:ribosome-associated heat shock protein Hsp15
MADAVRLDKWLWAARFFRTRAKAKAAIEGGKVHCQGQRAKAAKTVAVGDQLTIRQGFDEKTVTVLALDDHRGRAEAAAQLYLEAPESLNAREAAAAARKAQRMALTHPLGRPGRDDRRALEALKRDGGQSDA